MLYIRRHGNPVFERRPDGTKLNPNQPAVLAGEEKDDDTIVTFVNELTLEERIVRYPAGTVFTPEEPLAPPVAPPAPAAVPPPPPPAHPEPPVAGGHGHGGHGAHGDAAHDNHAAPAAVPNNRNDELEERMSRIEARRPDDGRRHGAVVIPINAGEGLVTESTTRGERWRNYIIVLLLVLVVGGGVYVYTTRGGSQLTAPTVPTVVTAIPPVVIDSAPVPSPVSVAADTNQLSCGMMKSVRENCVRVYADGVTHGLFTEAQVREECYARHVLPAGCN